MVDKKVYIDQWNRTELNTQINGQGYLRDELNT